MKNIIDFELLQKRIGFKIGNKGHGMKGRETSTGKTARKMC